MVEHLGVSLYGWDWDLVEMLYPAEESVLGHRGDIHATHEHTGPVSSDLGYSVLITEHAHRTVRIIYDGDRRDELQPGR